MAHDEGTERIGNDVVAAAALAGDEAAFGQLVERHRRELHVHCYRMLASYDDAEDIVQETFLRAWNKRHSYAGRSTVRAWLYQIATNACLDFLRSSSRRARPYQEPPLAVPRAAVQPPIDVSWLQPYPDSQLDAAAPGAEEPDAVVVAKETIELAYLMIIQQLPPRQRAVLIMRDVLGWSAAETAALLETSVASVKSALQRARATVQQRRPPRREEWDRSVSRTEDERRVLERYIDAHERADVALLAQLLADDVVQTMPPYPAWLVGCEAALTFAADVFDPGSAAYHGRWRSVLTWANRQPAVAQYVQRPSAAETRSLAGEYRAQVLDVLRIENGAITGITSFEPRRFAAFGLPLVLA
ncbi:sigma-70 family RNA polymerase sigma factor [Phytoactinopolyspora sp. XMNu-373]|uniref:RNA polymerase sigma factor n=2 Tax=Phytoactinopolyspora mesophila TaxID=2650750 RepID=A0A7K3LXK3_9ACTN|nr:sigma-70 family RNA polymerase sigma factor [Phytoactinopolyspora mesophila]